MSSTALGICGATVVQSTSRTRVAKYGDDFTQSKPFHAVVGQKSVLLSNKESVIVLLVHAQKNLPEHFSYFHGESNGVVANENVLQTRIKVGAGFQRLVQGNVVAGFRQSVKDGSDFSGRGGIFENTVHRYVDEGCLLISFWGTLST